MRDQFSSTSGAAMPRQTDLPQIITTPSPQARAIIINLPGYKGDIRGYRNKYDKIGRMLAERGIGAYVQMGNRLHEMGNDRLSLLYDLTKVIKSTISKASTLCAVPAKKSDPVEIYLVGTSAGAAAVAAAAGEAYEGGKVTKILLVAPEYPTIKPETPELTKAEREANTLVPEIQRQIEKSLTTFEGEVYIVAAEKDEVAGVESAGKYRGLSRNAELIVIPDCDHHFTGTKNGRILSKAPLWAFAGEETFPSPEGGLELY